MGIVKRQGIQAAVATYAGVFIGYVNLILLFPRFLTPEQFGLTRVMISVAVIFSSFSTLGIPFALMRFFPYFNDKKAGHHGFFSFCLGVSLAGFLLFSVIFLIFRTQIQGFFAEKSSLFNGYYYYLFPLALFMVIFEMMFFYMRALLKTVVPTVIREVVLRLMQTSALLLLALQIVDFDGFLILFIATYLLHLLILLIYVAFLGQLFLFKKINFEGKITMPHIIRYSLFIFAGAMASYYTVNIDQIMLAGLAGLKSNAVYSIAFFAGTIIMIPGRAINQVALPIISDAWKNDDIKKLQSLYTQTSLNEFIIGSFLFLILWINTSLLLSLLPPEYSGARWAIFIVGVARLVDLICGVNGEIIFLSKHVKVNLVTNLTLIVVVTVSNYLLIPVLGVIGSAIATALSYLLYNGIRMAFLFYRYRLQPFNADSLKALVLMLACFGLYNILPGTGNLWVDGIYQSLVIGILISTALIVFRISPEITNSYKWLLSKLHRN